MGKYSLHKIYRYGSVPYSKYDFVHFVDDWIVEKFGNDPKELDNLPFVGFQFEHSTTLREFCRQFMEIYRDSAAYCRY